MMTMENRWQDIDLQYTDPDDEYYNREMKKIDKELSDFCAIASINKDDVKVNVKAIKEVIRRIDMRQLYFQIYHRGMQINEYKFIIGLGAFWIVKLHPFYLDLSPEEDSDEVLELALKINEKFALHIVTSLLKEYNSSFIKEGKDLYQAYCDELVYSFRYRDLSKEALFLMFDPFYYLYFFNSSVDDDGKKKI